MRARNVTTGIIVGLVALLGLVAGFFAFNAYIYEQKQGDGTSSEPYRATLAGTYVCLPHTETSGVQTDECAAGLRTDVGEYYALDFGLSSQTPPVLSLGDRVSASGMVTPAERLSADYWRQYPIEGIFSATDSVSVSIATLPKGTPLEDIAITPNNQSSHSAYFDDTLIAPYASVPDAVLLSQAVGVFPAGTLLVYFNDTTQDERDGQMSFGMIYSTDDGATWSNRITVPIDGSDDGFIAADASIVQLDDGTLRLYFYALNPRGDIGRDRDIFAAASSDGLAFALERLVYHTEQQVNNPEVVKHDGRWYLFLTNPDAQTAGFSVSDDPLAFTNFEEFPMKGILGAASDGDRLLIYGCSGGITESSLEGDELTFLRNTPFGGCDPSPYFDASGTLHMVTKKVNGR